jgi:hypothetical protein
MDKESSEASKPALGWSLPAPHLSPGLSYHPSSGKGRDESASMAL